MGKIDLDKLDKWLSAYDSPKSRLMLSGLDGFMHRKDRIESDRLAVIE